MAWSDTFLKVLKDNDVRLVTYVPDNVLTRLAERPVADTDRHGDLRARHHGRVQRRSASPGAHQRPVLDALGIAHHTLTDEATMPFTVDRSIKQAFMTQASVAFILSPLLTGGNPAGNDKLKSAS